MVYYFYMIASKQFNGERKLIVQSMKWVVLILREHMAISRVCLTLTLDWKACASKNAKMWNGSIQVKGLDPLYSNSKLNGECSIHIYSIPLYESYWIYRNCQKETKKLSTWKKGADNWFLFLSERKRGERKGSNGNIFGGYSQAISSSSRWSLVHYYSWIFFYYSLSFIHTPSPPTDLPVSGWFPFWIQFLPPFSYAETSIS